MSVDTVSARANLCTSAYAISRATPFGIMNALLVHLPMFGHITMFLHARSRLCDVTNLASINHKLHTFVPLHMFMFDCAHGSWRRPRLQGMGVSGYNKCLCKHTYVHQLMSLCVHVLRNVPMLQCNRVALYTFSKPLHTGYADHGIPLKGRPPQSPDELQVERKT